MTRIAAGPDGVAVAFKPGAGPAPEDIDALAPPGDAIDWNGERLLLNKHGLDLEQARHLAFDLLTELD